jgi:hypothetical protein
MFPVRVGSGPFSKRFCSATCRKAVHEEQRKATADPGPALPAPQFAAEGSRAADPRTGEGSPGGYYTAPGTVTARPGAAAAGGSPAAPRLPDAVPERVERPFATRQRADGASDPAALRPVSLPWEGADGPRDAPAGFYPLAITLRR